MDRRDFLMGFLATSCALSQARPASAAPTVLRIGFSDSVTAQSGSGAMEFARQVALATQGRIRIEIYPNAQTGGDLEMAQDIALGAMDIGCLSSGVLAAMAPGLGVFDIPFLFRDVAHARAVLDGPIGQRTLSLLDDRGLVALAWSENGLRHVTTNDKPIRTAADLKGLKIRVPQMPVIVDSFKALGAEAKTLAFSEVYPALASGALQAQENPLGVILSANFDRVQHVISLTGHVYSAGLIVIGKTPFDRLAPDDQDNLRRCARLGAQAARATADRNDQTGLEELRRRGMTVVSDIDRQSFVDVLKGLEGEFENRFGKDLIHDIRRFGQ